MGLAESHGVRAVVFALLLAAVACVSPVEFSSSEGAQRLDEASGGATPRDAHTEPAAMPGRGCIDGEPFDGDALQTDVAYLASVELAGRVPGTPGDVAARAYIEERFRCLGLEPGADGGSYQQLFVNKGGASTANVIGFVRGRDPLVGSDIVLIGVHHDHVGTTGGKNLRRGANDNASGVAGLLAVARAVQQRKELSRRTIAFVSFGSEEPLSSAPYTEGSATFVAASPSALPIGRVVYMIDLEMIGTYPEREKVDAIGTLAGTPAAPLVAELAAARPDMRVVQGKSGVEGGTDFYPFCRAGIPFVLFSTPDDTCHHKACDKPERLDYAHLGQIAQMSAELTIALADGAIDLAAFRASAEASKLGCSGG